jgi:Protein of unknown function (DUF3618)
MDETANEIEAQIDRTRERLGSNLRELEDKVDAATDWREHFRERPHLFLGAAFIGGIVLASALRPKSAGRARSATTLNSVGNGNGSVQAQALELWNNVQAALVGVASARLKEYIGDFVPGFDEHYRRAEQRARAIDPTTSSISRTPG